MPDVEYLSYDVVAERGWSAHEAETFEMAAEADLDEADHGRIEVLDGERRGRPFHTGQKSSVTLGRPFVL